MTGDIPGLKTAVGIDDIQECQEGVPTLTRVRRSCLACVGGVSLNIQYWFILSLQLLRALSGIIHAGVEADPSQIHARVTRQDWWTHPPSSDFHSPIHQELVESWGVSRSSVSISSTRSMGGVVPGDPWGPGNSFIRWGALTGLEQGGWKHWSWNVTNNSRDCHQFGTDLALSCWRVTDLNVTHCHYLDHRVIKTPQSGRPIRVESGSQLVIR